MIKTPEGLEGRKMACNDQESGGVKSGGYTGRSENVAKTDCARGPTLYTTIALFDVRGRKIELSQIQSFQCAAITELLAETEVQLFQLRKRRNDIALFDPRPRKIEFSQIQSFQCAEITELLA